jgi:F-type H+-transporting ATPase subunit b
MQLDWFTTVAQIVNFLILVALLKRFLYGPIVRAMNSREAHIAARLHEAEDKLAVAERQTALYHDRLHELDARRDALLVQAKEDAEAQRQHLLEQARQDVQQAQARWHTLLQQERLSFLQELRQQAGQQVCAVARQALTDLASVDLERVVVDHFLERLQGIDDAVRHTLATAAHAEGVVVRSAFPMPSDIRQRVAHAVHTTLVTGVDVAFATQPNMLCGIELEVSGHKIAWNLAQYVVSLEERMDAILTQELRVGAVADG